ncbi:GNAT family N-acetyltransferase [Clostridium chauvoei]|uniref:GNAT family N-acetyltransferase n=2 Tax=Clostridium chauvoei TaxID=46867 RepID=A0ABD4RFX7_9CLOT|nr:GNAT family N-acetyltransferase [Clostridium chauvoei]ATD55695.1 hypothetical protein BTM20_10810 [Clostridium chauvoei]ATD56628.1 hypothetical protein BTM21_02210 [Clostridium chauvoei]MBX7280062.1 GNAT family N-acetyltransferase [Clostridium chauvoei]MBX7282546.1 GNAT family N-acetyltransferase [Clostridium chauvoei]MBX7284953.1 GNAT family N-acetyltransferase [Clostridium chauvoei]
MINFRLAKENDLDKLCNILDGIIENKPEGLNWSKDYPNREVLKTDIEKGELFVLEKGDILGVVVLNSSEDINYKNISWNSNKTPLVIHRLFIANDYMGKGYGKLLIEKIIDKGRNDGFESIRLDTFSKNINAQKLYTKSGFTYKGTINLDGKNGDFFCYEIKF